MGGTRVLIVDDDPDIVVYLTSFLEDHGYEARPAADSADAIEAVSAFDPELIIADVLLPGRSGLDLLVTLRHDPRHRRIPIVVMTGMEEILQDDCHSYLANHADVRGPDAVLGKPIDPQALLAVLAVIGGRSLVPAS